MKLSPEDYNMVKTLQIDTEMDVLEVREMTERLRKGAIDENEFNAALVGIYERIAERDAIFDEIKRRTPK